jgi:para-aminobenzoate synthetase / 4-amino-4-deoxychorismate lyase
LKKNGNTLIFLDTVSPCRQEKYSYVFSNPVRELVAEKFDEIPLLLDQINDSSRHYWLAGYLAYEAAYALEEKFISVTSKRATFPLGWFGVFESPSIFDHQKQSWNHPPEIPLFSESVQSKFPTLKMTPSMEKPEYIKIIHKIKKLIEIGEVYQINYTFDYHMHSDEDAWSLYQVLRKRQKAAFSSFIRNEYNTILSFSPEFFFRKSKRLIWTQPMKGTERRGRFPLEDRALFRGLSRDRKNQSENIMIVDLLRNDLGKICQPGSIKVSRLFRVQTYPTLHQMTSTIRGRLKPNIQFKDILGNLFPSGSVTGAPKIRAMEWIHAYEKGGRGVYCGAIGFVSPAMKKAVFSVPIRTLQKKEAGTLWQYRVGSGIVWDSDPVSEWKECLTKCAFLTEPVFDFEIMESFLWNGTRFVYLQDHLLRCRQSARFFSYPFCKEQWDSCVRDIFTALNGKISHKVRIFLNKKGGFRWDFFPLETSVSIPDPRVLFSDTPLDEKNPLLFHKTTFRPWYQEAMKKIKDRECFDVIFRNTKGQITEGSITNIFIQKGKDLLTPALECGLLPGILRQRLLLGKKCREAIISMKEVFNAEAVFCGNSVRGLVRVRLEE